MQPPSAIRSFDALLRELLYGPSGDAYILNPGDRGLLASLDALSASAASARPGGQSSVAAHVNHLRYGLGMLNRWAKGENPWADGDYAKSWERQDVTDDEWRAVRASLADEAHAWANAAKQRQDWDDAALTIVLSSVVHLAYHVGAIRQIAQGASGPGAPD